MCRALEIKEHTDGQTSRLTNKQIKARVKKAVKKKSPTRKKVLDGLKKKRLWAIVAGERKKS